MIIPRAAHPPRQLRASTGRDAHRPPPDSPVPEVACPTSTEELCMVTMPDLPPPPEKPFCGQHQCDAEICGGPHRVVRTDLGNEVLAPGEQPEGTPKEQ